MEYVCYISDSVALNDMQNILNALKLNVNINFSLFGEKYIQLCLYNMLISSDIKCKIINIDINTKDEIKNIFNQSKIIILPGWINVHNSLMYFNDYYDKIYTYIYLNMKTHFKKINPFTYSIDNKTLPLYPLFINNLTVKKYSNDIRGFILGKCISHNCKNIDRVNKILNILEINKINIYSYIIDVNLCEILPEYLYKYDLVEECKNACEIFLNHKNIVNLNNLNKNNFESLQLHCDYILCLGHPFLPPTIIECLYKNCIIICPKHQCKCAELENNTNIYNYENENDVLNIITNIHNGKIKFNIEDYPKKCSVNNFYNSLLNIQ